MNKLDSLIMKMNELEPELQSRFDENGVWQYSLDDEKNEQIKDKVQELRCDFLILQKECIDEGKPDVQILIETQNKNHSYRHLLEYMKSLDKQNLDVYKVTLPLRKLSLEMAVKLIMDVFKHVSVFYTPDFFEKSREYGIDDSNEFSKIVFQIDKIITVHITRHFDKVTARKEFVKLTGVCEACADVYEEMYAQNYQQLMNNILLDKVNKLLNKMQ